MRYGVRMATKRYVIHVCDVCEDQKREVSRYRVSGDKGSKAFDLCSEHAQPLNSLFERRAKRARKATRNH